MKKHRCEHCKMPFKVRKGKVFCGNVCRARAWRNDRAKWGLLSQILDVELAEYKGKDWAKIVRIIKYSMDKWDKERNK